MKSHRAKKVSSFTALESLLQEVEPADAATLDRMACDYPANPALLRHLAGLAESGDAAMQIATTALLKRYQERGGAPNNQIIGQLLDMLPSALAWEAALHILQMLAGWKIPRGRADALCEELYHLSCHQNKFVRAWAYGGLHHLAAEFAEYGNDVAPLLERASREEVASVRARLRQLSPLRVSRKTAGRLCPGA